jgi:hypothetical protein
MRKFLVSKWIKVEDRVPPYNEKVLICTKDYEVVKGHLAPPKWTSDQSIRGSGDVIYWMPLGLNDNPSAPPKPHIKKVNYLTVVK